jgi:hypothetical protein
MWVRIFSDGSDSETLIEVPEELYGSPAEVELEGCVLAHDHHHRVLIGFCELDPGTPCWLPGDRVDYRLYGSPHDYGWGIVTIPSWLASCLDQLTAGRLRDKRAERVAERDKKREGSEQRRRQAAATAAMLKKRKTRQGSSEPGLPGL